MIDEKTIPFTIQIELLQCSVNFFLAGSPSNKKALFNPAMKLRGGGARSTPPPLNFIAKISNANKNLNLQGSFDGLQPIKTCLTDYVRHLSRAIAL
jgi:hypothetical protein